MEIEIKIPAFEAQSYIITIGEGILSGLWETIETQFTGLGKFVVTDKNLVDAGHLESLLGSRQIDTFVIDPPGEISKNVDTAIKIIEKMEKIGLGRDTIIIALGGGTVGDIAGFAAAIFKRGIKVAHIPTTTVAQADSSIGGKTGVDSSISKNAFGAFRHPSAVYIDVATLKTLPQRQYRAGLVESVKHAIIADKEYFEFLEANIANILQMDLDILQKIAEYNSKIKGDVVYADPYERNMRRMLNYGHTIGHAAETASNFELLHGEAVAVGIIAAGMIETEMGLNNAENHSRIRKILEKLEVPVSLPENLDEKTLMDIVKHDKKAVNKWPRFVLATDIGKVCCQGGQYGINVQRTTVEKVLESL